MKPFIIVMFILNILSGMGGILKITRNKYPVVSHSTKKGDILVFALTNVLILWSGCLLLGK